MYMTQVEFQSFTFTHCSASKARFVIRATTEDVEMPKPCSSDKTIADVRTKMIGNELLTFSFCWILDGITLLLRSAKRV